MHVYARESISASAKLEHARAAAHLHSVRKRGKRETERCMRSLSCWQCCVWNLIYIIKACLLLNLFFLLTHYVDSYGNESSFSFLSRSDSDFHSFLRPYFSYHLFFILISGYYLLPANIIPSKSFTRTPRCTSKYLNLIVR